MANFLILLVMVAIPVMVCAQTEIRCVMVNRPSNNGLVAVLLKHVFDEAVRNSNRTYPKFKLPVTDPYEYHKLGPYPVFGGDGKKMNIELTDGAVRGLGRRVFTNVRVTDTGFIRHLKYEVQFPYLSLTAKIRSAENPHLRETYQGTSSNVTSTVFAAIGPEGVLDLWYTIQINRPITYMALQSYLPGISHELVYRNVARDVNIQLDRRILNSIIKEKC